MDITVHVSARLNVTQVAARRKVNVFLLNEIGTGLGGDTPMLVIQNDRLRWRVPVILALSPIGRLGQVGQIDVDAQTGEILADDQLIKDMPIMLGDWLPVPHYKQSADGPCLPACVRMVLACLGRDLTESQVAKVLRSHTFGTPAPKLRQRSIWGCRLCPLLSC